MPIDYSKYPPNWKTEIRPRILDREDHKCKFCKAPNGKFIFRALTVDGREVYQTEDALLFDSKDGSFIANNTQFMTLEPLSGNWDQKAIKVVLTIAHLDHDEDNWDVKDDRLAALCQRCHLRYDAPEKARRRKAKEHKNQIPINFEKVSPNSTAG